MQATTAKRTAKRGSAKARALVRGEPVVRGILAATLEELAERGAPRARIEDVATRGVNKTTRLPALARRRRTSLAALLSVTDEKIIPPTRARSVAGPRRARARDHRDPDVAGGAGLFYVFPVGGARLGAHDHRCSLRAVQEAGLRAIIEAARRARRARAERGSATTVRAARGLSPAPDAGGSHAVVDRASSLTSSTVILLGVLRPDRRKRAWATPQGAQRRAQARIGRRRRLQQPRAKATARSALRRDQSAVLPHPERR